MHVLLHRQYTFTSAIMKLKLIIGLDLFVQKQFSQKVHAVTLKR